MGRMAATYPMFPRRGAGLALLALRLSVAGTSIWPVVSATASLPAAVAGGVAALLALGVLTPAAACAAVALHVGWAAHAGLAWTLVAATQAACVGLLGPGAYSLDAARFGRRTLEWPADGADERVDERVDERWR